MSDTKLTTGQEAVLNVLKQYHPIADHALVPLAQHQMQIHQSSSSIRSRRKELLDLGLIRFAGECKTGSGRRASMFEVV